MRHSSTDNPKKISPRGAVAVVFALVIFVVPGFASAAQPSTPGYCNGLTTPQCTQYTNGLIEYRNAFDAWNSSLRTVNATHRDALKSAISKYKTAVDSANRLTGDDRSAALTVAINDFWSAVAAANTAHTTAIRALGTAPKRPKKPTPAMTLRKS